MIFIRKPRDYSLCREVRPLLIRGWKQCAHSHGECEEIVRTFAKASDNMEEPVYANIYESDTAGGTVYRINPVFLDLMKERGMYNAETMERIAEDQGSVQAEDWLTDHEKAVFKTAFEVSQFDILRMAGDRQVRMNATGGGQGQSTSLYIPADAKEEYISELHHTAFIDPNIESLYYIRSLNGATKIKIAPSTCSACEG